MPLRLSRKEFDTLIMETINTLPAPFREALDNIAIVVQREPSYRLRRRLAKRGTVLFGLYEGVPLPARDSSYHLVAPDVITIFQEPICRAAQNRQELKRIVRDTILHELAHYFGFTDEQLRELGCY